jgi:hypothetical protein
MQAGSRSLQVNLFQNDTLQPRLTEAVATSIRRGIQRDGTFRLATQDDGDWIMNGKILTFDRGALSFQPADVLTVRDYSLYMTAKVIVIDRGSGKKVMETTTYGRTVIRAGSDLASAERQAIPLMAEDMARNLTSQLVDGSW